MDINRLLRSLVLVLSAAAMMAGVLIILGRLVPRNFALGDEYRFVVGSLIFLYGLYRFVVTWFRRPQL